MSPRRPTGPLRRQPPRRAAATRTRRAVRPAAAAPRDPAGGRAPGMPAISTYLAVANVAASAAFLERAFGFERGVVLSDPDGQLRYAEMRHGGSVVMLIRKGETASPAQGAAALYAYVQDVDRALARAREAGGGVGEAGDRPWGDRTAAVVDPDGYQWVLATFRKLVPFTDG